MSTCQHVHLCKQVYFPEVVFGQAVRSQTGTKCIRINGIIHGIENLMTPKKIEIGKRNARHQSYLTIKLHNLEGMQLRLVGDYHIT